jgi:hypothetical protein
MYITSTMGPFFSKLSPSSADKKQDDGDAAQVAIQRHYRLITREAAAAAIANSASDSVAAAAVFATFANFDTSSEAITAKVAAATAAAAAATAAAAAATAAAAAAVTAAAAAAATAAAAAAAAEAEAAEADAGLRFSELLATAVEAVVLHFQVEAAAEAAETYVTRREKVILLWRQA